MRWIAYTSNESGRYEIYVRPFAAAGPSGAPSLGEGKWQISRDGGSSPRWAADGKQIIFAALTGPQMGVDVKANGVGFEAGIPQVLFPAPPLAGDEGWDVTADGKRFLMLAAPRGQVNGALPINVELNWPARLKNK
jgi:eukaryotic-like serine/threonine-protein kinase